MSLICFQNGSLAREAVAKEHSLDWDAFADAILNRTQPGNEGNMLLYYFTPEVTPRILKPTVRYAGTEAFVNGQDANSAARAIVESQALSMQLHTGWISDKPSRILVTGGASRNPAIRQVLADVFQAEILSLTVNNSAGLGAALRAAQAIKRLSWQSLANTFSQPDESSRALPNAATADIYREMSQRFVELLAAHIS